MHPDLETLVEVDRLDREIERVLGERDQTRAALDAADAAIGEADRFAEALQADLAKSRDRQHEAERKAHRYRARRASAVTVLETGVGDYAAAERQVAECDRIVDELETTILEEMESQDELVRRIKQADAAVAEARRAHAALDAQAPDTFERLEQQHKVLKAARAAVFDPLSRDVRSRYELLVSRKKRAVARIIDNACQGCANIVQPQQQIDLQRGLIVECRGCHRWLVTV